MGRRSKKKKRGGTGRRRAPSNDHTSIDGEHLTEELTALHAILQVDDVVLESPSQIKIKLRPYSQDSGHEDLDVPALLSIRFLPGYPYTCPELLIIPEKKLSKSDADNLLSLLHDQANLNAREGRVMIYSLVVAAQEFLYEVVIIKQPHLSGKNVAVSSDRPSKGPFVYGPIDLFIGSGESWHSTIISLDDLHRRDQPSCEKVNPAMKIGVVEGSKPKVKSTERLDAVEEESNSTDSLASQSAESVENVSNGEDYPLAEDTSEETDYADSEGQYTSPTLSSRYLDDFEELKSIGHGGFGHVVLCKNKLDGRQYAVKKIRLKDESQLFDSRTLREVATLARLQHQHVVRYYQAWFGTVCAGSTTAASSSSSYTDHSSTDVVGQDNKAGTYLYIQMEYCPSNLQDKLKPNSNLDKKLACRLFRQIVEGLAHIHGQGIIHRDLTPKNILLDAHGDVKIGDFGLAKFLKPEQLDQDFDPAETTGVAVLGTGQIGTHLYSAPEIEQRLPEINEKADMYSLGIVFFELWHPFSTGMERHVVLSDLKKKGELPSDWVAEHPEQAVLLGRMISPSTSKRPSTTELLQPAVFNDILQTMHSSEDTSIYDKLVNALFSEEILSTKNQYNDAETPKLGGNVSSSIQHTVLDTEIRDLVWEVSAAVFRLHCAKRFETIPMRLLGDSIQLNRNTVKLLTSGGDMLELCHELRLPFINSVVLNQKSSFKRFEMGYVYRRPIGHSPPNRYLQGDFDVIGGASALTEAEVIKAAMDIITRFFHPESCDIHLNHGDLLEAIWSRVGIETDHRQKVAKLLSPLGSLLPQSTERKTKWEVIRQQLREEHDITEGAVNKLQTVDLRFCGIPDQALPRLRGALRVGSADTLAQKALDELSQLFNYLRIWKIDQHVFIDPLMPPTESYHRNSFFQIYLRKDDSLGTLTDGTLLAVGGRYDYLLHHMWQSEYESTPPGAVGTSLALETIIKHSSVDICRPFRNDSSGSVLVCSSGGGRLLEKRMELVAELWKDDIKADFVPNLDPSLTEQYQYANEHDIKCLIIISDTADSQKGSVKVHHLELKREKEISRESVAKFLSEAMASKFRNPSIWN